MIAVRPGVTLGRVGVGGPSAVAVVVEVLGAAVEVEGNLFLETVVLTVSGCLPILAACSFWDLY